jgi:catechol 2,3-dioxygenase-like lactoylglutathione lyase family enzyme
MAEEQTLELFAGNRVSDYERAKAWWVALLGSEPSFLAHETEAIWQLADHASVFIVEAETGAGGAIHTIIVDDLDERVAAISARGIEPDERETYSNGVRKVIYRDPDGNEMGFGGVPA